MISYKIYPIPGMSAKTIKGSLEAENIHDLGSLINAISSRENVDLTADVPFLALLDGRQLNLSENSGKIIGDDSELLILPVIMGG